MNYLQIFLTTLFYHNFFYHNFDIVLFVIYLHWTRCYTPSQTNHRYKLLFHSQFHNQSSSLRLLSLILRHDEYRPFCSKFNKYSLLPLLQVNAFINCLPLEFTIIQGPPKLLWNSEPRKSNLATSVWRWRRFLNQYAATQMTNTKQTKNITSTNEMSTTVSMLLVGSLFPRK